MSNDTQRISSREVFTGAGLLTLRDQGKSEVGQTTVSPSTSDGVSTDISPQLNDALTGAEGRFIARANSSISQIQIRRNDLQQASDLVSRQISTAGSLLTAVTSGDSGEIQKQQNALSDLLKERRGLSDQISANNQAASSQQTQVLSLDGADASRAVTVPQLQFAAGSSVDAAPVTPKAVSQLVDSLKNDQESLNAQSSQIEAVSTQVQDAISAVKNQLDTIRQDALNEYPEAAAVAQSVAQAVREGGISVVDSTIKQNLNSTALNNLLN